MGAPTKRHLFLIALLAALALSAGCKGSGSSGGDDGGDNGDSDSNLEVCPWECVYEFLCSESDGIVMDGYYCPGAEICCEPYVATDSDTDVDTDSDTDTDTGTDSMACDAGIWEGDHTVYGPGSIAELSGYTEISGSLDIGGTWLTDLTGLECLISVGLNLEIHHNDLLTSVDGLNSLASVGGPLIVAYNEVLTDLDGLSGVTSVGENLEVSHNDILPDCEVCDLLDQITSGPTEIYVNTNLDDSCTPVPGNCP